MGTAAQRYLRCVLLPIVALIAAWAPSAPAVNRTSASGLQTEARPQRPLSIVIRTEW